MPYLDTSHFTLFKRGRVVSVTGDISASELSMAVSMFGAEINRFHNVDTDICTISDNTTESFLHGKFMADLVEKSIVYWEMADNIAPQNRVDEQLLSLWNPEFLPVRNALIRETREEKAKAMNYNLQNGRIRRWY